MSNTGNAGRIAAETERDERIATAAIIASQRHRSMLRKSVHAIPWFVYVLLVYVGIEYSVVSMRSELFTFKGYSLSWVEVIYLLAVGIAMFELLKVSAPGVDNTLQALYMLFVGVAYLIFFVLGAAGVRVFDVFTRTEFLFLVFLVAIQIVMAFVLNSRTLKRTIDNTNLSQ